MSSPAPKLLCVYSWALSVAWLLSCSAGADEAPVVSLPQQAATASSAASLPVSFDLKRLSQPPKFEPTNRAAAEGMQTIFYAGPNYHGKPTKVFAYYAAPPSAKPGDKFPAMVLIHGGGGTAFDRWVKVWNERGYAAIAMDLCGCVPEGTYGNWKRHDDGGPAGWDASFSQIDEPLEDQWQSHAVSNVVLAQSLLRSFPEVDADKIGVTGISWGGYMTCLVAGVDPRFRFAVPVYGCGHLGENSTWLPTLEKMGPEKSGKWLRQWDPSGYLPHAKMPILWVNGTNDFAYPMDSWQKSYRHAATPRGLCLRIRMPHGHGPAGENPEEIHAFANSILFDKPALAQLTDQTVVGEQISAKVKSAVKVTKVELCYTTQDGKWQDRKWEALAASLDEQQSTISAKIPAGARVVYWNVEDERGLVSSSEHVELPASAP